MAVSKLMKWVPKSLRRAAAARLTGFESLEARDVPATFSQVLPGVWEYDADIGEVNHVTVTHNVGSYQFDFVANGLGSSTTIPEAKVKLIVIGTADMADTVTVNGTAAEVRIFTGTGADKVTLNHGDGPRAIAAEIDVHQLSNYDVDRGFSPADAGNDKLVFNDVSTGQHQAYLDHGRINHATAGPVFYGDDPSMPYPDVIPNVTYNGSDAADVVLIGGTSATAKTYVNTGAGADDITLGVSDRLGVFHGLGGIDGELFVNGGSDIIRIGGPDRGPTDHLTLLDDGFGNGPGTYVVTDHSIETYATNIIHYAAVEDVTLKTTDRGDQVNVESSAAAVTYNLILNGGDDKVRLGDAIGHVDKVKGTFTIDGGAGADKVQVDDTNGGVGRNYTAATGAVAADGLFTASHQNVETVALTTGKGADTFSVFGATPGTAVKIDGGAGPDTLTGGGQPNTFAVTGKDKGTLAPGNVSFAAVEYLRGSSGDDVFQFLPGGNLTGNVYGEGGTDTLDYSALSDGVFVFLDIDVASHVGGDVTGIENVTGSLGDDLIVGDNNPNVLIGLKGRDILIGRGGADKLYGGYAGVQEFDFGDDLLVGGSTVYDTNFGQALALYSEWTRTDLPGTAQQQYDSRVQHIRFGGGLNGQVKLNAATVIDDGAADLLNGGGGRDLFFGNLNQDTTDSSAVIGEVFVQIP